MDRCHRTDEEIELAEDLELWSAQAPVLITIPVAFRPDILFTDHNQAMSFALLCLGFSGQES